MIKFRLAMLALVALPMCALAQNYPSRAIHMVVPYPAGGSLDTVARIFGQKMGESMKQPVVIDNRAGGNTVIGTQVVATSPPDGYTLLFAFDPPHTALTVTMRKVPFDPITDFAPITMVAKSPLVFVVNSSLPVNSLKEFIAYAKARPGQVFFGVPGNGSPHHFALERLNQMAKIKLVNVPYKGVPAALTDLLGGQLQASISTLANVTQHFKAGKLKPLAVADSTRSASAPDIPTVAEAGLPGYRTPELRAALLAPAGTPPAIIARLHDEAVKAGNAPGVRARLDELGFELILDTPAEMAEILKRNVEMNKTIAAEAGIEPE